MLRPTVLVLIILLPACADDLQAPMTVTLELTAATTGESIDPDGYLAQVDGGHTTPLGVNATTVVANLSPGAHEVALSGIAPNCLLDGQNPRRVTTSASEVAPVHFEVHCGPPTGSVQVATSTGGLRPDADGYGVTVADSALAIGPNASLTVSGLPVGDIRVELTGVATNCLVDGDNPRTVPLGNGELVQVAFAVTCGPTGDGILLFTSDRSGSTRLYRIKDDGTQLNDLTPSLEVTRADWSPDGSRIVFSSPGESESELFTMSADGSNPVPLGVAGIAPKWSPDGRKIVFTSNVAWVTLVNTDGTGVEPLVEGYEPAWSPDGTRIAFERVDRARCVADLFCPSDLYVMNADGSGAGRLVAAANASDGLGSPVWSPDGASIAYIRSCCFLGPDESGVYVVRLGVGVPQLIYSGRSGSAPVWSPDGSGIAFGAVRADATTDITVVPAGGGAGRTLAVTPRSERPQAWR